MHHLYRSTSLALTIVLGVGYAAAQEQPRGDRKKKIEAEVEVETTTERGQKDKSLQEVQKVSDITGFSITNRRDESLGSIEELVMTEDGKIKYAIVGHGGVLGIGQDYIAVPWQKIEVDHAQETVRLDIAKAELEQAPTFKADNYQELHNPQWTARVHQHFGVEEHRDRQSPRGDARPGTERPGAQQPEAQAEPDAQAERRDLAGRQDRKAGVKGEKLREGMLIRTSQLIGADVQNPQREGIASVNDLVLDRKDKVSFVILGKGGFLTLGESQIAVPLEALNLQMMEDEMVVMLDMTDERLKQAPTLEQEGFQDLRDRQYVENARRFFGVTERREIEAEAPAEQQRRREEQREELREEQREEAAPEVEPEDE